MGRALYALWHLVVCAGWGRQEAEFCRLSALLTGRIKDREELQGHRVRQGPPGETGLSGKIQDAWLKSNFGETKNDILVSVCPESFVVYLKFTHDSLRGHP